MKFRLGGHGMRSIYFGAGVALLALALPVLAPVSFGQADQAAQAEKQKTSDAPPASAAAPKKESSADALAALLGGKIDKEGVERGRKIFVPTCGFCHGNDAHGKSGPDLVRSTLVLHDNKGDAIGRALGGFDIRPAGTWDASVCVDDAGADRGYFDVFAFAGGGCFESVCVQDRRSDYGRRTTGRGVFQRPWNVHELPFDDR